MVELNKLRYWEAKSNKKREIAMKIVEESKKLDPPTRFLQKHASGDGWYEVDDAIAREKTMQALRSAMANDPVQKAKKIPFLSNLSTGSFASWPQPFSGPSFLPDHQQGHLGTVVQPSSFRLPQPSLPQFHGLATVSVAAGLVEGNMSVHPSHNADAKKCARVENEIVGVGDLVHAGDSCANGPVTTVVAAVTTATEAVTAVTAVTAATDDSATAIEDQSSRMGPRGSKTTANINTGNNQAWFAGEQEDEFAAKTAAGAFNSLAESIRVLQESNTVLHQQSQSMNETLSKMNEHLSDLEQRNTVLQDETTRLKQICEQLTAEKESLASHLQELHRGDKGK